MKKICLLLLALVAMTANAKTVETILWEGTYTDGVEIGAEAVAALKAGDVLRIYATVPDDGGNFKIVYKGESNSWAETTIPSFETQWPWINGGDSYKEFTLTSADITALEGMNIYVYSGGCTPTKVSKLCDVAVEDVTIGTEGIATWSHTKNLNFAGSGLKVYYVSEIASGKVTLKETETTWNYCGYLVKGTPGTYEIPVVEDAEASYPSATYLKGNTGENTIAASTAGTYHYIFGNGDLGTGFYKLTADHTLAANKAYLETETDIAPANGRVLVVFDDETTGISTMHSVECIRQNHVYDLQGRRVIQPRKGLYVINGKKMIIK